MQTILNVIVPIFGLIAVGAFAARMGLLSAAVGDALARFVFVIAVPALLFRTLATSDFGNANPFGIWLAYFSAIAVTWTTATLLARRVFRKDRRTGVIAGISASFANTVFVALPTVQRAYGEDGLEPLLVILSIHLPVMMIVSTLMIERAAIQDARADPAIEPTRFSLVATVRRVGRNLLRNALVLAILGGLAWRLTGLGLEAHLDELIALLGGTAAPVALFSLGMSLVRFGLSGDLRASLSIAALSLLVMPGLVYLLGQAVGLSPLWLKAAVVTAASPAGVNAYLFATYFGSGEKLAATSILISTILSVASLALWLTLLG